MNNKTYDVVLDDGAIMPARAHDADAGYDLFSPRTGVVPAHNAAVFDTGVHIAIPEGYCGLICAKSGLNIKGGILTALTQALCALNCTISRTLRTSFAPETKFRR